MRWLLRGLKKQKRKYRLERYCSVFFPSEAEYKFFFHECDHLQSIHSDSSSNASRGKTLVTLWTASVVFVSVFSGREPENPAGGGQCSSSSIRGRSLRSSPAVRRPCVRSCECAGRSSPRLCSPPSVFSGVSPGPADPPASPRSVGAWSPGSPSSGSPPSQLLRKRMLCRGYHPQCT